MCAEYKWHFHVTLFAWHKHTLYRKFEIHNPWTESTPQRSRSWVWSAGSGNRFGPFPFQKAPSEKHPIKISFHLSNHFTQLNKGNASSTEGREGVLLGWFHRSAHWIIPTVTLIDLARPPFLLSLLRNKETGERFVRCFLKKNWHSFLFVYRV